MTIPAESIAVFQVPTGLEVPLAMQQGHERLLAVLDPEEPPVAKNLQAIVDNENSALIFALRTREPGLYGSWGSITSEQYVGTLTLVLLQTTTRDMGYLDHVVTDPQYQRRGIGRSMVQRALTVAKSRDVERINLTSNASREAAQKLYESTGFHRRETVNWRWMPQ